MQVPSQIAVTQELDDSEQVYDLPPSRKTPQKPVIPQQDDPEQVYDLPPSRKSLQFTEQNVVNQQQYHQDDTDQVYDLPPSRRSLQFTEQSVANPQEYDTEQVYDLPPTRKTPQSSSQVLDLKLENQHQHDAEQLYDLPPARKTPLTSPVTEQKTGFELYDTVETKSSENSLYVPAQGFEREDDIIDETYEVPPKTLPTDFASLRNFESVNTKQNDEIDSEDTYDIPSNLNSQKEDLYLALPRNTTTNQGSMSKSPQKPVGAFNRALAFDMGRIGKRHSEPIIPVCKYAIKHI